MLVGESLEKVAEVLIGQRANEDCLDREKKQRCVNLLPAAFYKWGTGLTLEVVKPKPWQRLDTSGAATSVERAPLIHGKIKVSYRAIRRCSPTQVLTEGFGDSRCWKVYCVPTGLRLCRAHRGGKDAVVISSGFLQPPVGIRFLKTGWLNMPKSSNAPSPWVLSCFRFLKSSHTPELWPAAWDFPK